MISLIIHRLKRIGNGTPFLPCGVLVIRGGRIWVDEVDLVDVMDWVDRVDSVD